MAPCGAPCGKLELHLQARALCTAAERNSAWVGRARDKIDFAPKDAQQVALFLATERDAHQVTSLSRAQHES